MGGRSEPSLRIGVDTGGTFTDVVCLDRATGDISVTKVASTPANPALALATGVEAILAQIRRSPQDVIGLAHGTTVATNALLQGGIESLGLIVTAGFRHILEIARQTVPDGYGNSYFWEKPDRLVPLDLVCEVGGRVTFKGEELRPLDEESVRRAARFYRARGVRAVGVCLLHSYAAPGHELRVRDIVLEDYPDLVVSLSCEVLPEYREYERAVTTLVDAFVKSPLAHYLRRVKHALGPALVGKPFLVMQSNGGVMSADQVVGKPITTALSGPAAGVLGGAVIASLAGFENVVTLDAGGTSTDLSLIERGAPHMTNAGSVGPFPVRIPMIAIETIGTGGGSIAWISRDGRLRVGPESAGADPGPMCYPHGGDEPTVTDANLVLGRLPPALIGGAIALDVARSCRGLADLAQRLRSSMTLEQLAAGLLEIANWNQADRIRQMTIQRGIDPRSFALLSFGGAGPVQSAAVMQLVGMKACLVPPDPGNLAAFGLLAVDFRTDHLVTSVMPEDSADLSDIGAIYEKLECDATERLLGDGIPRERIRLLREADLRYSGQSMEVRVSAPSGDVGADFLKRLTQAFHSAHRVVFGYDYNGEQKTEIVNLFVSGFGMIDRPQLAKRSVATAPAREPRERRQVWFGEAFILTPVYDRSAVNSGTILLGPAIIEEFGSTVVLFPGQRLRCDEYGVLVITSNKETSGARA